MLENVIIVLRHKGMGGLIVVIYYDLKVRFFHPLISGNMYDNTYNLKLPPISGGY